VNNDNEFDLFTEDPLLLDESKDYSLEAKFPDWPSTLKTTTG
jgi:hypothetical protein